MARPLTARQARFVELYLVSLNATQAASEAGYSAKTAASQGERLLKNAEIRQALQAALAARSQRTEITQDYVLSSAREVLERCLQRAPVLVRRGSDVVQATDEQGRDVWQFDARGANGALSLLAKHVGIGGPSVTLNVDMDKLNRAQLEHIANGGSLAALPA